MIEFGRTGNQISHTFRHTDAVGLDQLEVRLAILAHLQLMEDAMPVGAYTGNVQVKGASLEYRAYRFNDGIINVGRITVR